MIVVPPSSSNIRVGIVNDSTGMGIFATKSCVTGEVIYKDIPLVSIQHTANRRFVKACQNCHRPLGGARDQLEQIFKEPRFANVNLSSIPTLSESRIFNCHCGEMYCSPECGKQAFEGHHYCLCVATMFGEAVSDFKFYCLAVEGCGDNLLLLSQLLAVLARKSEGNMSNFNSAIADLMTYTNRPFNEVARPPCGSDRDVEWEAWLESTILESFKFLKNALSPQNEIFKEFFENESEAFQICSRILSIFELNNIDIAIPTMLGAQLKSIVLETDRGEEMIKILREKEVVMRALWNDEAQGIYEDEEADDADEDLVDPEDEDEMHDDHHDDHHSVEEMLDDIRNEVKEMSIDELMNAENPAFHGTGFYLSVARTNHSCDPNVQMDFDQFNCTVTCKALKQIGTDSELRMSYIARPDSKSVEVRRHQRVDYLVHCKCEKCMGETI